MESKTEICNLAISHIGVSKDVSDIDTERSAAALACKKFYERARDEVFRDFNWPFATKYESLGLVETSPNTDWGYSYRYPSTCIRFRKILSGVRNDSKQSRVVFEIASDSTARLIFTDEQTAVGKFNARITDEGLYPEDFVMMLSLLIAAYIAPRLTGGDPFKLGDSAFKKYILSKTKAESTAFNEENNNENVESEFIRDRL